MRAIVLVLSSLFLLLLSSSASSSPTEDESPSLSTLLRRLQSFNPADFDFSFSRFFQDLLSTPDTFKAPPTPSVVPISVLRPATSRAPAAAVPSASPSRAPTSARPSTSPSRAPTSARPSSPPSSPVPSPAAAPAPSSSPLPRSDFPFLTDAPTSASSTPDRVDYGTLPFAFRRTTVAGRNLLLMAWNGTTPSPVLSVRPGQTLSLAIDNRMPPNRPTPTAVGDCWPPPGVDVRRLPPGTTPIGYMNNPHGFRSCNVHTHGLQTSPYDDDAFLEIAPGATHAYSFAVPPDHPTGLFWYHPHKHGAVHTHASNGVSGLLVVRGAMDEAMHAAGAREVLVHLHVLELNEGADGVFANDPLPWACAADGGYSATTYGLRVALVNGRPVALAGPNRAWTTAGLGPLPTLFARPGELLWLRVANSLGADNLDVGFSASSGPVDAHVTDYDGISLPSPAPFTPGSLFLPGTDGAAGLMLPASGRVGLLVRAPRTAGASVVVGNMGGPQALPAYSFFRIVVAADGGVGGVAPRSSALLPSLPGPTARNAPIADADVVLRRVLPLQISGFPNAPPPNPLLLTPFGFFIDGRPYKAGRRDIRIVVGTSEEWRIDNPTSVAHGWHVHINSFFVSSFVNLRTGRPLPLAQGFWADTVYVPPFTAANIRIRAVEFFGTSVGHCHLLQHEEQGMMLEVDFVRNSSVRASAPTQGQAQGEHAGHDGGGAAAGSAWEWPLPSSYLFEGEEALAHPVAVLEEGKGHAGH